MVNDLFTIVKSSNTIELLSEIISVIFTIEKKKSCWQVVTCFLKVHALNMEEKVINMWGYEVAYDINFTIT